MWPEVENLGRRRLQQSGNLEKRGDWWMLRWREEVIKPDGSLAREWAPRVRIGPCTGPERLTQKEAKRIGWEDYLSKLDQNTTTPQSVMTVAQFVEQFFIPEHVMMKKAHTRLFYRSRLKDVLTPDRVVRAFGKKSEGYAKKYKNARVEIKGWPYLDDVRLRDLDQSHVQRVIAAAMGRDYSPATVNHIRTVCSAIVTYAKEKRFFRGDNPAESVRTPAVEPVKDLRALTLEEAKTVLGQMQYPEYHISVISILTSMNIAEICGLQWKRVNITDRFATVDGETLPPFTVLVRKQWNLGKLDTTKRKSRKRALPIPPIMLSILAELKQREKYTSPDDYVLVSRKGTPVDAHNLANRKLKTIGKKLDMPWLSWHVLRRTHTTILDEMGMELSDRVAMMGHGDAAMTMKYTKTSLDRRRVLVNQLDDQLLGQKPQGPVN